VFTCCCFHSGRNYSLVRVTVICSTKSFLLSNLLCLLVAAFHSCHQKSLVRGIVVCYTKSVGTPHGGRVVCLPVETGRARCCGDSSKFVWLSPAHCTMRAPWLKIHWRIASELRNSMGCSHPSVFVSFAIPNHPAAPKCFWTSAVRCIR
jgi:hypothetical protein